jgi:hypothetical protein
MAGFDFSYAEPLDSVIRELVKAKCSLPWKWKQLTSPPQYSVGLITQKHQVSGTKTWRLDFSSYIHNISEPVKIYGETERYEVFTTVNMPVEFLWVVTPCSVSVGYRRFWIPCCLHLHPRGSLNRSYSTATLNGITTYKTSIWSEAWESCGSILSLQFWGPFPPTNAADVFIRRNNFILNQNFLQLTI